MKIRLIAVGTKMPAWISAGYQEYAKRFPAEMPLELIEIAAGKRGKNADLQRLIEREGQDMLAAIGSQDRVISLEVQGQSWTTEQLANKLSQFRQQGQNLSLLVGGPEGLAPAALARADLRWSLSALTLPHPLVRILLAESLYRAWSLMSNHPYHRA